METLAEYLAGSNQFDVTDDMAATRAMKKLQNLQAEWQRYEAQAVEQMKQISDWLDRHRHRIDNEVAHYEGQLAYYYEKRLEQDPKMRVIDTPYGSIRRRKQPPEVCISDEARLIEWAQKYHDDLLRYKSPELDRQNLRKMLESGQLIDQETGEVLASTIEQPDKIIVKVEVE